ncbi:MAG: FkbM family methyltransferase [Akkermansiaceae bacterium]|nr:FkbM family methyltransferase [Akkermansiaceae bacterium]MCF7730765.1 FkbM family methyltransferase [Akkermansiaceae bacterium]
MKLRSRIFKWYANYGMVNSLRRSAGRKFRRAEHGRHIIQATKHGFSLHLRIGDPVDTYTAIHSEFEPALSNLIKKLAPECSSFIDVGCNIGYFTCLFHKHNPHAPILAIDANPEMVVRCNENIKLNGFSSIEVVNIGVADKEGIIPFNVNPDSPSLASFGTTPLLQQQLAAGTVQQIDVRTQALPVILAEAGITRCGLIKIDIEGYEPSLFAGLDEGFHLMADRILFEYVPCQMEACGFDSAAIWSIPLFRHYRAFGLDTKNADLAIEINDPANIPPSIDTVFLIRDHLPVPFVCESPMHSQ